MSNDTTFRNYTPAQVKKYGERRGGYALALINEVIASHARNGGSFGCLVYVGCGPGNATRDLALHFDRAVGIDPSLEMITLAERSGGRSISHPIQFLHDDAESCRDIPDKSVDLINSATAAHWFDMDRFWHTADRVLKANGTVAFLTIWRIYVHPLKTAHANEIQNMLFELEQETLGPYQKPGNWNLMGLYNDFQMPWSLSPACESFSKSRYQRQVWNENGVAGDDGTYVCSERLTTLHDAEKAIATISAV